MAFYREHPVAFGLLLGLVGAPILVFAAIRYPSFYDLMFKDAAWTRFVVFTATIFPLAIAHFRPRHGSGIFWAALGAVFVVHMVLFAFIIQHVRQLTSFDYVLCAPFEALAFAFLIPRATRMFRGRRLAGGPDTK
jgi:drug/metabolite transporter (DMT)-like permease